MITKIKEMYALVKSYVLASKKRKILSVIISSTSVIFIVIVILIKTNVYSLSPDVKFCTDLIPDKVQYYFQIADIETFIENISGSQLGKEIAKSETWEKVMQTPQMQNLSHLLFFLQLQSKSLLSYKDLSSFINGPIGIAYFENNSYLVTAKINIKAKIGVSLYTSFKSEKIPLDAKKITNTNDKYKTVFPMEQIAVSNIFAKSIEINNEKIYMVMLGDYIVISNNLKNIELSLKLGSKISKKSLLSLTGMDEVAKIIRKNNILLYIDKANPSIAPLVRNFIIGKGLAIVGNIDKNETFEGNIFAIGHMFNNTVDKDNTTKNAAISWEALLPQTNAITVYSNTYGVNDFLDSLEKDNVKWKELDSGIKRFFSAAGINTKNYFNNNKELFFTLHKLSFAQSHLYPHFSLGFFTQSKNDVLLRSIFKVGKSTNVPYQGKTFTSYDTKRNQYYRPAMFMEKEYAILSTQEDYVKEFISAKNGNRPVLSDTKSYKKLGIYNKSPHHIIVNINTCISSIREFFNFGAHHSKKYTSKTVEKDVMPLFIPFNTYKMVHIALGKDAFQTGKIIISD